MGIVGWFSPSLKTLATRSLAGSALRISAANLVFVTLSTLQVLVVGAVFGTSRAYEIFVLAWMLPDWCLLGLGNVMQLHLTPTLLGIAAREGESGLQDAAWSLAISVTALLAGVCGLGALLAYPALGLLAPGLAGDELDRTVLVFRLLMLTAFLQGLVKLLGSLHRVGHSLVVAAMAQAGTPLAVIGLLLWASALGTWVFVLGFTLGALVQIAVLLPALRGWRLLRPRSRLDPAVMKDLATSALPLLLATTGFRLVVLLGRTVASGLDRGDVAVLRYAFFFLMAVQGLLIMPVLSVGYNRLSALASAGRRGATEAVLLMIKILWTLVLPATLVQVLFARPLVDVFLGRQAFDAGAVARTSQVLAAYALTLPFLAGHLVALQAFLSRRRLGFVTLLGLVFPALGLVLNLLLSARWGVLGIAIATPVTMAAWFLALLVRLLPEAEAEARRRAGSYAGRLLLASGLALGALGSGWHLLPASPFPRLVLGGGALLALYAVALLGVARQPLRLIWNEFSQTRMGT